MRILTLLLIVFCCVSCIDTQNEREPKFSDAWKVSEKRNTIDTSNIASLLHNPEIHIEFSKINGNICSRPYLDFYPIAYSKQIQKQLFHYLAIQSSSDTTNPVIYRNKKHIVIAWDFKVESNQKYCDYNELTKGVISRYHLRKYKK